jgi:hypothetical protein
VEEGRAHQHVIVEQGCDVRHQGGRPQSWMKVVCWCVVVETGRDKAHAAMEMNQRRVEEEMNSN